MSEKLSSLRTLKLEDGRTRPFTWVANTVITDHLAKIGPTAFAVLMVLTQHANSNQECWPSMTRIATMAGVSRNTAATAIAVLVEDGLLAQSIRDVKAVGKDGKPTSFAYFYKLQDAPPTPSKIAGGLSKTAGVTPSKTEHEQEPSLTRTNELEKEHVGAQTAPVRDRITNSSDDHDQTLKGDDFAFCSCVCDQAGLPSNKRVAGGIRAIWQLTRGTSQERRRQFEAAIDAAAAGASDVSQLIAVAKNIVRKELGEDVAGAA